MMTIMPVQRNIFIQFCFLFLHHVVGVRKNNCCQTFSWNYFHWIHERKNQVCMKLTSVYFQERSSFYKVNVHTYLVLVPTLSYSSNSIFSSLIYIGFFALAELKIHCQNPNNLCVANEHPVSQNTDHYIPF